MMRFAICAFLVTIAVSKPLQAADIDYLMQLYRHLHENPELSFQEQKTAARIADELSVLGFSVTQGVGGYGLVGVLENGAGPTVLVRTDLDGLPVQEATGLEYASVTRAIEQTGQEVDVMHACGHDVHMAAFVGTAQNLVAARDSWSGTLVMIGQPAEERGAGARAMLADGLFERFPRPDFNLTLHVAADAPAGSAIYIPGWAMANVDSVDIQVHGIGGHGAYPQTTKDPIVLAADIILTLQTLVSREIAPIEPAVVTVGSIHGGAKHNVIPDQVDLQLTVRSYSDDVRNALLEGIRRIAHGQARAYGIAEDKLPTVTVKDEYTPAVYNSIELLDRLVPVLTDLLGEENLTQGKPSLGGEDFGQYGRVEPRIPSLLLWIGGVEPGEFKAAQLEGRTLPSLHSAQFAPDAELAISTGIDSMTAAVLELLGKPETPSP